VAFPTDLFCSSTRLFCHKGQTAFHGCSVPLCFKPKYSCCFKLNFVYGYALCNEVYWGGGPRVNFHRFICNIRTRACATHCGDRTFGTPVFVYGMYRVQVSDPNPVFLTENVCGVYHSLQANARMLLNVGSQPLRSSSFAIQYSLTIRYATDRVSCSVV
jgi:hypothetical protein